MAPRANIALLGSPPRAQGSGADGTLLWEADLPASAEATPMTYRSASGKQFVVIAAGGHAAMEAKRGDHVVAFTLP